MKEYCVNVLGWIGMDWDGISVCVCVCVCVYVVLSPVSVVVGLACLLGEGEKSGQDLFFNYGQFVP